MAKNTTNQNATRNNAKRPRLKQADVRKHDNASDAVFMAHCHLASVIDGLQQIYDAGMDIDIDNANWGDAGSAAAFVNRLIDAVNEHNGHVD